MADITEWQAEGLIPVQVDYGRLSGAFTYEKTLPVHDPAELARIQQEARDQLLASPLALADSGSRAPASLNVWSSAATFGTAPETRHHYRLVYTGVAAPQPPTAGTLRTDLAALLAVAPHLTAEDVLPLDAAGTRYVEWENTVGPLLTKEIRLDSLTLRVNAPGVASTQMTVQGFDFTLQAVPYFGTDRPFPGPTEGTFLGAGPILMPSGPDSDVVYQLGPLTVPVSEDGQRGIVLIPWAPVALANSTYASAVVETANASVVYQSPRYRYRPRPYVDERREARGRVNGVLRDLYSIKVDREIATVLPSPVAGGGGILSGSADIEMAETETVTTKKVGPWDRKNGWPIAPHESVELDVAVGPVRHRVFTGRVEKVSGSAPAQEVVGTVRDEARWLDTTINHQALLASMPPVDKGPQREIGLRPDFIVDRIFRQGGFYATPPREQGSSLSVPAQGTLWPEGRGPADASAVRVSPRRPKWYPAPWGWCFADVAITYSTYPRRRIADGFQLSLMVAPDHAGTAQISCRLGESTHSIRLGVMPDRLVTVAITNHAGATRSWRPPTPGWEVVELRIVGSTWTLRTDKGDQWQGTVTGPAGIGTEPIADVDVTASAAARIGAFQLSHPGTGPAFQAVSYRRTAHLLVGGMFDDLVAMPALERRDGLQLLGEISEAMVASVWVDEVGHAWWVHPDRMRDQPVAHQLTSTADLLDLAWEDHSDNAREMVTVLSDVPRLQDTGGVSIGTKQVSSDIGFDPEQWTLKDAAKRELDDILEDVPGTAPRMKVEGHTDNLPNTSGMSNQTLSERRAKAVADYIRTKRTDARIEVRGYGDTRPVATNSTAEGRAKNRRVVITWSVMSEADAKIREYAVTVWEGSGDTTNAGDVKVEFPDPGGDDWIMVAPPAPLNPGSDLRRFNMGLGSWAGALQAFEDGEEEWRSRSPVVARLEQIGPAAWKLTQTTAKDLTVGASAVAKVAEDTRLAPSRRGDNLPVLRAKVKVEWETVEYTSTIRGPAHLTRLEHQTGPWIQAATSQKNLVDWIARQVTDPPAVLRDLPIEYSPEIRLGQVVELVENAVYNVSLRVLVVGLSLRVQDGSAEMTLTGRIIRTAPTGYPALYEATYRGAHHA